MNDSMERRSEVRLNQNATIYVEVSSASYDNSLPANVSICTSIDISANGIQVEMDEAVAVGSILRICAEFSNGEDALFLVGESKWVRKEDNHYKIGFELYDAENTDISSWKQAIATKLEQE